MALEDITLVDQQKAEKVDFEEIQQKRNLKRRKKRC